MINKEKIAFGLARRCGLKKTAYNFLKIASPKRIKDKQWMHDGDGRIDFERVSSFLGSISPDPKSSTICHNEATEYKYDLQIIMPVYNVGKYLRECLESVFAQIEDLDYKVIVIAVNDGSTDSSLEILKEYQNRRNFRILDQKNGGLSVARNNGLKKIQSEYIMFIDSDDMLAPGSIKLLMDCIVKNDYSIVQGNYDLFDGRKSLGIVREKHLLGYPWAKIYKSSLFRNLHFPPGYWFEDTFVHFLIHSYCRKDEFKCLDEVVYRYRVNEGGIVHSSVGKPKNLDTLYVTASLLRDASELNMEMDNLRVPFLEQLVVNYRRISNIGSDTINHAVFLYTCCLYQRYFSTMVDIENPELSSLDEALRELDYRKYILTLFRIMNNL
ncbi:MAG: glycosyltransferase [Muribaculaceae bacterium]|nr:glycosyltransferase [Muribaculaceae bacterium]